MPGLSFLSKKSFHTTNVKNVERVWLAEQKAQEEQKRLAELQKQLQEERQILELRQLQAAHGQVTKTIDNSLDWMYEGPMSAAQKQQSSEEFLLGKIYNGAADHSKVEPVRDVQAPAKWLNKVASKNDSFTRAHEDPFVMIKQEENKRREKVINNPIKMDKIKQKIALELKEKDDEKSRRKAAKKEKKASKKEAKKLKKEAKRRDTDRANSSSSSSESEVDVKVERTAPVPAVVSRESERDAGRSNRSQSRDNSRDRRPVGGDSRRQDGDKKRSDSRDRTGTQGRGRSGSRDRNRDNSDTRASRRDSRSRDRTDRYSNKADRSRDRDRDRNERRDYSRRDGDRVGGRWERSPDDRERTSDRRRSPSPDSRHRADCDDRKRIHSPERQEDTRDKRPRAAHDDGSDSDREQRSRGEVKRYGLLPGKNGSSTSLSSGGTGSADSRSLGPNQELLNRKLESERQAEAARRNRTRVDVKGMSEEERLRKIQEMQSDADHNDALRATRHHPAGTNSVSEVEGHSGNAAFLESMRKSVYTTGEIDMRSRIDQNKHCRQSSADIDSAEGFIRK